MALAHEDLPADAHAIFLLVLSAAAAVLAPVDMVDAQAVLIAFRVLQLLQLAHVPLLLERTPILMATLAAAFLIAVEASEEVALLAAAIPAVVAVVALAVEAVLSEVALAEVAEAVPVAEVALEAVDANHTVLHIPVSITII